MKLQEKLAHWLASKNNDYKYGVDIFIGLGIDSGKNSFFINGPNDKLHQGMLFRQLTEYARINKIRPKIFVEPQKTKSGSKVSGGEKTIEARSTITSGSENTSFTKNHEGKKNRVKIDTNPSVRFEGLPFDLQEKFKENGQLANEMKTIHAELKAIKDNPEKQDRRSELAKLLVDKKDTSRKNWDQIDIWWTEKQEKSPEEFAARAALEKDKRIKANLNYIRRYHGNEKHDKEVKKRMLELDKEGFDYAKLIETVSGDTGNIEK